MNKENAANYYASVQNMTKPFDIHDAVLDIFGYGPEKPSQPRHTRPANDAPFHEEPGFCAYEEEHLRGIGVPERLVKPIADLMQLQHEAFQWERIGQLNDAKVLKDYRRHVSQVYEGIMLMKMEEE